MGRSMKMAAGAIVLVVPALCLWFFVEADQVIEAKREALTKNLPPLLAADAEVVLALFEKHPLFAAPTGEDAGPFLNDRLGWQGDDPGTLVPESCRAVLSAAGASWRSIERTSIASCDTSWLRDLRAYGRWTLSPGFRERQPHGPRNDFGLPNLIDLQHAAKLHLLKADDPEAAAQDVRHLARLLFTHHYLMSAMIGIALLSVEAGSWDQSSSRWSPPPLSEAERLAVRRHLFAAVYALSDLAPAELTRATIDDAPGFRRCVLFTESAFMRRLPRLPEVNECALEQARFELEHPWVQPSPDDSALLSWPARAGGQLAKHVLPARHARTCALLGSADGLPAEDGWDELLSEALARAITPR